MQIKAEIVFTYGHADAIRKGSVPSEAEMTAYAKGVIKEYLADLKGTVGHTNEDWVRIRISSVKLSE